MKAKIFEKKEVRQVYKKRSWHRHAVNCLLSLFTLLMVIVCYGQNQVNVITNANKTND